MEAINNKLPTFVLATGNTSRCPREMLDRAGLR